MSEKIWSYRYKALASKVLVVAVINKIYNEWSCFIDAVAGERHLDEFKKVGDCGTLLEKRIADILFPSMDSKYTWVRGW